MEANALGNRGAFSTDHLARSRGGNVGPASAPVGTGNGNSSSASLGGGGGGADTANLANAFGAMNLHSVNMPNGHAYSMGHAAPWMTPVMDTMHPAGYHAAIQQNIGLAHAENPYSQMQGQGYHGAFYGMQMPVTGLVPFTPARGQVGQHRGEGVHPDVPALENRRGSYSTNESTPATPFWGGIAPRENAPRVANHDRSAYTTPSPQHLGMATLHLEAPKPTVDVVGEAQLDTILTQEPAIPKAVPAVFTPPGQMKSVDQSLENRIPGNRNVYIRGLHPTTDDELLAHFARRFGPVETSKAIIDTATGACKGFGFAKFYNAHDSELCIRGFHRLGYEVGFARESFNSRLKAQGDDTSTNLYISNLPKTMNEVELGTIFLGYNIISSKILRDNMGNSRGVGFARFESRDVCDKVMAQFTGVGIGEDGLPMNLRYADTPSQKELKRITAERRQFRTNEYNIGAYGTTLVGTGPSTYGQQSQWRRNGESSQSVVSAATHDHGASGSQPGGSSTTTSASTDATDSTPTSSECDEGVTIHADPSSGIVVNASAQSSPSAKKESAK